MKPTETELAFAADVRARVAAIAEECKARGYTDKRGWTSYPVGTAFSVVAPTNEERSRAERIEFRAKSLQHGQSYTAYLTRDRDASNDLGSPRPTGMRITTFTGDTLAHVTRYSARKVRGVLSDVRGSFWACGIDGRTYYGRHNGPGVYCTMRLAKGQVDVVLP